MTDFRHHSIFTQFPPVEISVPAGFTTDYLGNLTRAGLLQSPQPIEGGLKMTSHPSVDEEYFEWIDILQSVVRASSSYTMLELGAGYGRWAARAHLAARRHGCQNIHLGLVEAEPAHAGWIATHMADNNVSANEFRVFDTVLGTESSARWFMIAMPPGSPNNTAQEWYGQGLMDFSSAEFEWVFGRTNDPRAIELESRISPETRSFYAG